MLTDPERRGRGRWRRWLPRRRSHAATLDAAEAYRRWSGTYAEPDNELQRLESDVRRALMPAVAARRVLEVGAGTGRVTEELLAAGAMVFATDLVAAMLERAPARSTVLQRACVARAEAVPFRSQSFDMVVSTLTLGHVADLAAALASMTGALRSGGDLLITDFHPEATLRGWQRSFRWRGKTWAIEQHVHPLDEYARLLGDLGCAIDEVREKDWDNVPVLFGLRAHKASPTDTPLASASTSAPSA